MSNNCLKNNNNKRTNHDSTNNFLQKRIRQIYKKY